ncbi:hypothetical protein Hanom_Chr12g01179411 [Helianthus anomalus]
MFFQCTFNLRPNILQIRLCTQYILKLYIEGGGGGGLFEEERLNVVSTSILREECRERANFK